MSEIDFPKIVAPLSADDPCGPDLDLEGDSAFMNYMAQAETALPPDFFKRDGNDVRIFDRTDYDFDGQLKIVGRLLERTRDVRLLSLAGRLYALKMDLRGCAEGLAATATLLRDRWDEIHPRAEDGDFGYRLGVLQSLNDMPTMILPLQHLPLFRSRRYGGISQRTCLLAAGRASPRGSETVLDEAELQRALREADPDEVEASRDSIARLGAAARSIAAVTAERVGMEQAIRLERLVELADEVLAFLGSAAPVAAAASPEAADGPALGLPGAGQSSGQGSGQGSSQAIAPVPTSDRVVSAAAAGAALAAASRYFRDHEPSSPAALLLHQAERLIGLPFQDIIRTLLPQHADGATIFIGPKPDRSFQINLERIASEAEPIAVPAEDDPAAPHFVAAARAEAVSLMREAAAFFRRQEPSSPVPLFIDRALALLNQDFLALLADVLPGVRLARDE